MAVAHPVHTYIAASIVFILVMSPQNLDLKHYIIAFCHAVGNFIFEHCQGLAVARPWKSRGYSPDVSWPVSECWISRR